jgi:diadenosine tetraphosphate (Ap4A) HIT family hydrolase
VVFADDADHPCFVRVVWGAHVRELSDLADADRVLLIDTANTIERCMLAVLAPHKINHASFGNMVPHLHWHIVPRWIDDAHWPGPVWAARQRDGVKHGADLRDRLAAEIRQAVGS